LRFVKSLGYRGWALLGATALCIALPGVPAAPVGPAHASVTLEERKLPMRFTWVACEPNCRGWITAVGIVTADSPKDFDDFARGRQLGGATIVLDSSGGSVNDSIALGRRWRNLGALTTVGISVQTHTAQGDRASVVPEAYCESMCVFLLLSGKTRYVPQAAHVRVHQIWMGDRADDAKAASYSAQDLMIVERDIGRLAKYTFDMGGAGDLLSLSLNVPPWEELHELSREELRLTNLVTTDAVADVLLTRNERDRSRYPGNAMTGHYLGYLEDRPDQVVAALRSVARAPGAVLVNCAAGKDRTGVVVALALSVAGVRPDAIAADYAATGDRTEPLLARLRRSPTYADDINRRPPEAHRPQAATMTAFLAELQSQDGGAAAWLTGHGLSQDDLDLLRAKLRDPGDLE